MSRIRHASTQISSPHNRPDDHHDIHGHDREATAEQPGTTYAPVHNGLPDPGEVVRP